MNKPRHPEKGLPHFKLEEALREEGCAICRLVGQAGHSYVDSLLYESVNDPDVQKSFRDSLGLCNRHAYAMLDEGDGLGTAILYRVVARRAMELLSSTTEPAKTGSVLSDLFGGPDGEGELPEPGVGCMVCNAEDEAERRYLRVLLDGAEDGSLDDFLDGPGFVCVRHLSRASALDGGGLPRTLVEVSQAALEGLEGELAAYIRHRDYRHSEEPWGEERDSWRRVVARIIGRRGL